MELNIFSSTNRVAQVVKMNKKHRGGEERERRGFPSVTLEVSFDVGVGVEWGKGEAVRQLALSRQDTTATPMKAPECSGSAPETVRLEGSGSAQLCAFEPVMTT